MSTPQMPKPHNLLIQMSGAPGSGKSTMAAQLGRRINGVVIDHDAQHIIKQGLSVIVDSTRNCHDILDRGSALANQDDYTYWYIECRVQDIDLLDERLRTRDPMTSQRTGVDRPPAADAAQDSRALFKKWIESPFRPKDDVLIVDSTRSPDIMRDEILKHITSGMEVNRAT
ncbi:P-loop containing nucleoside triphosphate hydrolase protein [Trichoderma compactum]